MRFFSFHKKKKSVFCPKISPHNTPLCQVNLPRTHLRAPIPPGIGTLQSLPVTRGDLPRIIAGSAFLHRGDPGTSWLPSTGDIPLRTYHAQSGLSTDSAHRYASSWVRPVLITIVSGDEVPSSLFPSHLLRERMVDDMLGFLPFQGRGHQHWIVSCDTIEEDTLGSCSWDAAQMPITGALAPIESLTCQRPLPRVASRCPGLGASPPRFQDTFILLPCSTCSVPALSFALHGESLSCPGASLPFFSVFPPLFRAFSNPSSCVASAAPPPSQPCFLSFLGALLPFPAVS